jgi:hypothetical protein
MDIYSFTEESKPFEMYDLHELVYEYMEKNIPLTDTNLHTIYIPSKGRPLHNKTARLLTNLNYKIVVEPQDYDSYRAVYPEEVLLRLDANDKGLAYVRNYISNYSRHTGETHHWQMDDDVDCFKVRKKNTNKNETVNPLLAISIVEHCTNMFTNVAISGIGSNAFAFSKPYPVQKNRLAYQCMLLNNSIENEWKMGGVEDWYYNFDVLEKGYCTLAFHHIMTQTSPTMQLAGGSTDIHFAGDKRKLLYETFIKQWPNRFTLKEYPDSKKRWRLQPIRKFFSDYKQNLILK